MQRRWERGYFQRLHIAQCYLHMLSILTSERMLACIRMVENDKKHLKMCTRGSCKWKIDRPTWFWYIEWVTGEYQTKVQNLILKLLENRLGTLEVLFVYTLSVTRIIHISIQFRLGSKSNREMLPKLAFYFRIRLRHGGKIHTLHFKEAHP